MICKVYPVFLVTLISLPDSLAAQQDERPAPSRANAHAERPSRMGRREFRGEPATSVAEHLVTAAEELDDWVDEAGDTMTGTLTLDPNDDRALDLASGSIYMGNALFIHGGEGFGPNTAIGREALGSVTPSGSRNVACGGEALRAITTGGSNVALGWRALYFNTTGGGNIACGGKALYDNTTGDVNIAIGGSALANNTIGTSNVAVGSQALMMNTGSSNVAVGREAMLKNTDGTSNTALGTRALLWNTTGAGNTALGWNALSANTIGRDNTAVGTRALAYGLTDGSRNVAIGFRAGYNLELSYNIAIENYGTASDSGAIRIGNATNHSSAFIAGIRGATTANADAIPVLVDSAGQLGTVSSSRRHKEDIDEMGEATDRLLDLRPVLFRYKTRNADGNGPLEYGLIAEEVAEVFPELVVYDDEGRPETVKYHLLGSMLLNELQKLSRDKDAEIAGLRAEISEVQKQLARLAQDRSG